jgi:hypothetical protein
MKVYLVWDGYEDVMAVFLSEENAKALVDQMVREGSRRDNFGITECEVKDAP